MRGFALDQVYESGCQFRFHSVFMKRVVIPSDINGVLVSGKSLDGKLPSFGLIWVASPPNTPF